MKATSLEPPNITRVLVRPSNARASCSPKMLANWGRVWAAQMNESPGARSLAIRVRRVGSGAVEGSSSRNRDQGRAQPASPRGAVGQQQTCVRDVFGHGGHQRAGGCVGVLAAEEIDGAAATDHVGEVGGGVAGTGDAAAADVGLEEQRHRLLHRGDGVADGAVVTVERSVQQAVPERLGVRVGLIDSMPARSPGANPVRQASARLVTVLSDRHAHTGPPIGATSQLPSAWRPMGPISRRGAPARSSRSGPGCAPGQH